MVVLAILGALGSIAIPRYRGYKERAYLSAMRTDLGQLRTAQELYWAENQQYSTDTASLDMRSTSDVLIQLTSSDIVSGYTAIATHLLLPGHQCATYTGKDAANNQNGAIICGPLPSGSAVLP